jgi:hypothetical protein
MAPQAYDGPMDQPHLSEKRVDFRFDKVFPVMIGSEIYGDSPGIARNISAGGMLIEMIEPIPLGAEVTVHFRLPEGGADIAARAEVKHHYCFNYADGDRPGHARGIGLRFLEFLEGERQTLGAPLGGASALH